MALCTAARHDARSWLAYVEAINHSLFSPSAGSPMTRSGFVHPQIEDGESMHGWVEWLIRLPRRIGLLVTEGGNWDIGPGLGKVRKAGRGFQCLASLATSGCLAQGHQLERLHDPLLMTRPALIGRSNSSPPSALALAEPAPPLLPESAWVAAPQYPERVAKRSAPLPDRVGPSTLPSQLAKEQGTPGILVSRKRVLDAPGHANDYSWLQGTYVSETAAELHFSQSSGREEAGRVRLEDDGRLAQLRSGDVIRVEGELLDPIAPNPNQELPRYRIHQLWLIQRAQ